MPGSHSMWDRTACFPSKTGAIHYFTGNFIDQVYAPYLEAIGPVNSWVDLGCNCGMFSLYLERTARTQNWPLNRRALLIDASPVALTEAREAIDLSLPQTEIRTLHAAVAGRKEFVEFYEGKTTHKSSIHSFGSRARKRRVPVVNLEKACAGFIEHPDLVKIDIEGAEAALLQDWPEWLKLSKYLIIEWHEPHLSGKNLTRASRHWGSSMSPLPDKTSLKPGSRAKPAPDFGATALFESWPGSGSIFVISGRVSANR